MVMAVERLNPPRNGEGNQPQAGGGAGAAHPKFKEMLDIFAAAMTVDLATPLAVTALEQALDVKKVDPAIKLGVIAEMDSVLGLDLLSLTREDLRIRPKSATITEAEITAALARRKDARAAKDFATSDAIRDELAAQGVEVMDGDPLGWEWKLA
jgi:cysteinyl-tRNA synthetase